MFPSRRRWCSPTSSRAAACTTSASRPPAGTPPRPSSRTPLARAYQWAPVRCTSLSKVATSASVRAPADEFPAAHRRVDVREVNRVTASRTVCSPVRPIPSLGAPSLTVVEDPAQRARKVACREGTPYHGAAPKTEDYQKTDEGVNADQTCTGPSGRSRRLIPILPSKEVAQCPAF